MPSPHRRSCAEVAAAPRVPGGPLAFPQAPAASPAVPSPLLPRPSLPPHPCRSSPVPGSPLQAQGLGKLPCLCLGAFMGPRGGGGRSAQAGTLRFGQREAASPCERTDCTDYIMESRLPFSLRVSSSRQGGSGERWQRATGPSVGGATPEPLGNRAAVGKRAEKPSPCEMPASWMPRQENPAGRDKEHPPVLWSE